MATRIARQPKGSRVDAVQVHWIIDRASKKSIDDAARRAGVSASAFIDRLVEHLELDDTGLPTWWPETDASEELPITPT